MASGLALAREIAMFPKLAQERAATPLLLLLKISHRLFSYLQEISSDFSPL
jgi:hypothetical protein